MLEASRPGDLGRLGNPQAVATSVTMDHIKGHLKGIMQRDREAEKQATEDVEMQPVPAPGMAQAAAATALEASIHTEQEEKDLVDFDEEEEELDVDAVVTMLEEFEFARPSDDFCDHLMFDQASVLFMVRMHLLRPWGAWPGQRHVHAAHASAGLQGRSLGWQACSGAWAVGVASTSGGSEAVCRLRATTCRAT